MPALFTARAHRFHAHIGEIYEIYEIYGGPREMYADIKFHSMKKRGRDEEGMVEKNRMHGGFR